MIFLKKKTIILVLIALVIIALVKGKNDMENVVIPQDAIRIRIIANTNDNVDIEEKMKVKKNVQEELYKLLSDTKDINEARKIINDNLERLNILVDDTTDYNYKLEFGKNYFPKKLYKGVIYDEGEYESLVITLGDGSGDNWWCVLFPPLCLLEGNENTKDVEYKFFVKELIDNYFKES